jgi:hypothetical protein
VRLRDLTGQRFGLLTATERASSVNGEAAWRCSCDCGQETVVRGHQLRAGRTRSCGCLRGRDHGPITHGYARHGARNRAYRTWVQMRSRCSSPTHHNYPRYGGRGIAVCARWLSFESFLADMGERPPGTTIDRIDNDRGYEPGNCRWATVAEQNRNRSDTRRIEIDGASRSAAEWARANGISPRTAYARLRAGWNDVDAVTVQARAWHRAGRSVP